LYSQYAKGNVFSIWTLLLGDNYFWGWAITIAYALAFILAVRRYLSLKDRDQAKTRAFWLLLSILLLLLGINKQLDFQTLFFLVAQRIDAILQRWGMSIGAGHGYGRRLHNGFLIEVLMLLLVFFGTIIGTIVVIKAFWGNFKTMLREAIGLGLLVLFTFLRTLSIYGFGYRFRMQFLFGHLHALEFVSLLIIIWAELRKAKAQEPSISLGRDEQAAP
jgi:hypothetical protein